MTSRPAAPRRSEREADRVEGITDLHAHIMPGVDDGAQDLDEAVAGLRTLRAEGVARVVATPHFRASLLESPSHEAERLERFDRAFGRLTRAAADAELDIVIDRASEFKLDAPDVDLSDPRLRLAGTGYALVEFASFQLPPFGGNQLLGVREAGWSPLLAHPERYVGVSGALREVEGWVRDGVLLQVNVRSLLGRYGEEAESVSREILRRGWACCLASDYHTRGDPGVRAAIDVLRGGSTPADLDVVVRRLFVDNPARLLADEPPEPVPGVDVPESGRAGRRRGWFRQPG